MARDSTSDTSIRRWLLAAVLAAVAMLAWLSWHAIDASVTVGKLADSNNHVAFFDYFAEPLAGRSPCACEYRRMPSNSHRFLVFTAYSPGPMMRANSA